MAKPRVLISSDIGGADPDDIQSMVHAFLYADKMNLVGLVSTPSKHGGRASHIHQAIDAYEKDYQKLKTWSSEYPTPQYLDSITKQGSIPVAPSKGWSSPSAGSQQIIKAAHAASASDPLWVLTWGSMTDLAQALHDDPSIKGKIKVYSIGSWNTQQDPAARNYVYNSHKDLWWIENNSTFRGMYVDNNGNGKNSWNMNDAKGHGALGDHFYKAMPWGLKMGDTPSILYMIDGADNNNPSANSWGGSFVKTGHGPNYWTDNKSSSLKNGGYAGSETVQKHQGAFYKDFAMRLDRSKTAKSGAPDPVEPNDPPPSNGGGSNPPPSSGGKGNPVFAGDDNYKTGVNQKWYFNTKYLLSNDKGADGGLKVAAVASKSAAGATVTVDGKGTAIYTPLKGWQGKDTIQYTLIDKDGSTDTALINMQVGNGSSSPAPGSSHPPAGGQTGGSGKPVVAGDDYYDVKGKHYFNAKYVLMNDKAPDGGLKFAGIDSVSDKGGSVKYDAAAGTVIYTPKAGFRGEDTVTYTAVDRDGSKDTAEIHFDVLLA